MTFEEAKELPKDHPLRFTTLYGTVTNRVSSTNGQPLARCTRNESLKKIRPATSHELILKCMAGMPPMSRAELALFTTLSISSLCGRIAELVSANKIEVVGTKKDPVTKRKVVTYKLKGGV